MSANRVIGVDVGGTKLRAAAVSADGSVRGKAERRTPRSSQEELLVTLDDLVADLLDERPAALGFGLPSTIDQRSGRAVSSVNIPLTELDFRDRMASRFGLPVAIENDANAAALGEWRLGAGRGTRYMVMLTLGTGLGGGLVLDGRLYRGAVGAGGELGHMVLDYDGPPCAGACPGRGHFEPLASGTAADALARELYGDGADAHTLLVRADEGDERAVEGLAELGRRLGAGVVSLVNIFNPEVVVVGGGFGTAGDRLLAPARAVVREQALSPGNELVRIVPAELGAEAGLLGAALVAFEALDDA